MVDDSNRTELRIIHRVDYVSLDISMELLLRLSVTSTTVPADVEVNLAIGIIEAKWSHVPRLRISVPVDWTFARPT